MLCCCFFLSCVLCFDIQLCGNTVSSVINLCVYVLSDSGEQSCVWRESDLGGMKTNKQTNRHRQRQTETESRQRVKRWEHTAWDELRENCCCCCSCWVEPWQRGERASWRNVTYQLDADGGHHASLHQAADAPRPRSAAHRPPRRHTRHNLRTTIHYARDPRTTRTRLWIHRGDWKCSSWELGMVKNGEVENAGVENVATECMLSCFCLPRVQFSSVVQYDNLCSPNSNSK